MSVGSRLGTSQTQDYVLLALVALGAYVVYNLVKGVKAVTGAAGAAISGAGQAVAGGYTATVTALGSGLYSLFGPDDAQALGASQYLMVNFPDGTRHAVPANTVNTNGVFTWSGYPPSSQPDQVLTLVKDASGAWYATSNTPLAQTPTQLQPVTLDQTAFEVPPINFGRWRE